MRNSEEPEFCLLVIITLALWSDVRTFFRDDPDGATLAATLKELIRQGEALESEAAA